MLLTLNRESAEMAGSFACLPEDVVCFTLALSSGGGFGRLAAVCREFRARVACGSLTHARTKMRSRRVWLLSVGACAQADFQPIPMEDRIAMQDWWASHGNKFYSRIWVAIELGPGMIENGRVRSLGDGELVEQRPLRVGRAYAGLAGLGGGRFIAVGGECESGALASALLLVPGCPQKALPSLQSPRRDPIVATLARKDGTHIVVVAGGYAGGAAIDAPRHRSAETCAVSTLLGWGRRRAVPWSIRAHALSVPHDGETAAWGVVDDRYLIIAGGILPPRSGRREWATNRVECFDSWEDTWRVCAPMPEPRAMVRGVVFRGLLYVEPETSHVRTPERPYAGSSLAFDVRENRWYRVKKASPLTRTPTIEPDQQAILGAFYQQQESRARSEPEQRDVIFSREAQTIHSW